MKRFSILIQTLVIAIIISACGAQTTPTVNAIDLQSTAVAAALTLIAETQSAIPTATPPSPTATVTNTPTPTNTFIPLPTEGTASTPNPGGNSNANDPCVNKVLPDSLTGEKIKIRIDNPTNGSINFSIYLQQSRSQDVCGYRAYVLAPQDSLVITDLVAGCYTLWAWNPDPNNYFMVTNGTSCLDTSNTWTFDITTNGVKLR